MKYCRQNPRETRSIQPRRGDFPSAAARDRVIKQYGADTGLMQTLARLEQYVSATVAGSVGARP